MPEPTSEEPTSKDPTSKDPTSENPTSKNLTLPEDPTPPEKPSDLLGNQGAQGSKAGPAAAVEAKQLEALQPVHNLLTGGHDLIPVRLETEHIGFSGPGGVNASHCMDGSPGEISAARGNGENASVESQEPCASEPGESSEDGAAAAAQGALLARPAPLLCAEPTAKPDADNGAPALGDKPEAVPPSVASGGVAAEPVHAAPAADGSAGPCQTDPSATQEPRSDGDGRSSQAAAVAPASARHALADLADRAAAAADAPPTARAAAAEVASEPPTSAAHATVQPPADGGCGDERAPLPESSAAEQQKQQRQACTPPAEDDANKSAACGSETAAQAGPTQLSRGDLAEPVAAAAKEDMDILGNGKLLKKVIKPGQGSHTRPQYGSQVTIKCQGQLPNGAVVDQSAELSFILHDGDVIAALDLAVALMELGEECELQAAPEFAYKGIGRHPDIPPDTPITYTIELLTVSEPPIIGELSLEQIIALADKKRDRGNYLYSRTEYDSAVVCYSRAVQIADDPSITSEDTHKLQMLLDLRLKCYNNLAATQVKAKQYEAAVESCEKVLKIQPLNVKALFRKGKSLGAMGSTKEAIEILKQALKLDPSTKVIHRELYKLQEKLKKDAEDEKILCMRMLGQKNAAIGPAASGSPGGGKQQSSRAATYGIVGAFAAVALSVGVFMLRKYL